MNTIKIPTPTVEQIIEDLEAETFLDHRHFKILAELKELIQKEE